MGLNLTLMPINFGKDTWWLGYNRLSFDRNYELFDFFGGEREEKHKKVINDMPIPKDIKVDIYGDDGLETKKNNPYGEPLTYFYAKDSKKIPMKVCKGDWNKAIIKFLQTLPKETVIVLEWR